VPLHIGSVTADITMLDGEMPLSERQLCQVAEAVLRLIDARQRDEKRQQATTQIMPSAQPLPPVRT
jgi:hypothetical protein